jgi:hypothetical protein
VIAGVERRVIEALRLQIIRARSVAAALGCFGLADVIGIDDNAWGIGGIASRRTFRPRSLRCGHAEQHYCHPHDQPDGRHCETLLFPGRDEIQHGE